MLQIHSSSRVGSCRLPILLCLLTLAAGCAKESAQPVPVTPVEAPSGDANAVRPEKNTDNAAETAPTQKLLVSAQQLQEILNTEKSRILDVRSPAEYDAGHVPGAILVDVNDWKALTLKDDGAGLHDQDAWSAAISGVGIDNETQVVVYSNSPTSAARIWWILKYVGVANVAILDGGWDAWQAADVEVSTAATDAEPAEFTVDFQDDRLSSIGDLKKLHSSDTYVVVDARSREEHSGQGEGKGRIPGAAHLEWKELLDANGQYKSKEELRQLFEERGIDPKKTAVTHCQTGGRASVNVFALELAGYGKVKNYYCGWSEWSKDEDAPRDQGQP